MNRMFEQPLYEYEPTPAPQQDSDLFYNYEVKGWMSSQGLFKILGLSAVANIVALLVFAQTSLLTMKGCDSPLVGSVCQVLDTVYVGSLLWGTDREFVDVGYDKIDLGDSEITYIDASLIEPPLYYPADYDLYSKPPATDEFAINDSFGTGTQGVIPEGFPGFSGGVMFPDQSGQGLTNTEPNYPTPNSGVVKEDDLPQSFDSNGGRPLWGDQFIRKEKKRKPVKAPSGFPTPDPNEVADITTPSPSPSSQPTVEPTDPVTDVELNKRPFVDLAETLNGLLDKKMVNLETPFKITATGKLGKDGKIDRKSFVYREALSPDPRMIEVIKEAIEAMNASGYLQYLTMVGIKDLSFEIFQDNDKVVAQIQSEFDNDLRPKTVSTLLNGYINDKKKAKEAPEASPNDKDDLVLLQNAKVEPLGKKVMIAFMIPKANVQAMIMRKLAEQRAQPKPTETTAPVTKPADPAVK